ncbi:MAG: hypothetical protein ACO3QC_06780, partial [Phycisphaerales bacterium]
MQLAERIAFVRDFDAPMISTDGLMFACGEIVAQLCVRLDHDRRALRLARIDLHHARVPASNESIGAPRTERTSIELRLLRPSGRAVHLWTILRPRLETVSLEYGVERIELEVLQSVLRRFMQRGFAWPGSPNRSRLLQDPRLHPKNRGEARDRAYGPARQLGRGIEVGPHDVPPGWRAWPQDASARDSRLHAADAGFAPSRALREWIDLVQSRLGPHAVRQLGVQRSCGRVDRSGDELQLACGVRRPSLRFDRLQGAVLQVVDSGAGDHCVAKDRGACDGSQQGIHEPHGLAHAVARSIAQRTAWSFLPHGDEDAVHGSQWCWNDGTAAAEQPAVSQGAGARRGGLPKRSWVMLRWGGVVHRVHAIDAWERQAEPWFGGALSEALSVLGPDACRSKLLQAGASGSEPHVHAAIGTDSTNPIASSGRHSAESAGHMAAQSGRV